MAASLIVQGDANPNHIVVYFNGGWTITNDTPLTAGEGCAVDSSGSSVTCPTSIAVGLVVITGGNGDDSVDIAQSVPPSVKVRVNGNAGSDTLSGGPGDDVLEAGENYNGPDNGNDTLIGNDGSDVLYADPGADQLNGGAGNDLLVSSVEVCQGHTYSGGLGEDTVSYGRSNANMRVELGGTGAPAGCGNPDHVLPDNEDLEGSDGPDVLVGDNGPKQPLRPHWRRHLHRQGRQRLDRSNRWPARQIDRLRAGQRRCRQGRVGPQTDQLLRPPVAPG